jgi:3,4-dihydroxy-2-butanone 4-phosphate synthase
MTGKQSAARKQVKVITHHTHAGKPVEPGTVLELTAGAASAMVRWGAGELVVDLSAAAEKQGGQPRSEDEGAGT